MIKLISFALLTGCYWITGADTGCSQSWAERILKGLTLEQKVAQLIVIPVWPVHTIDTACPKYQVETVYNQLKQYHPGGVIFLGNGCPLQQIECAQHLRNRSTVPLLIMQDCEWGLGMRLAACKKHSVVPFPRALTLGAITDDNLLEAIGYEIGLHCHAVGVDMNLAPVADVLGSSYNPSVRNRSYGDDPHNVARVASALARGMARAGVLTCAKHFPGHGNTTADSHLQLPQAQYSLQQLHAVALPPFAQLIANGVTAIMTGHLLVPEVDAQRPTSLSYPCVTTLLQKTLGFQGICITDALNMGAITEQYTTCDAVVQAFLAGNDLLLCPPDIEDAIESLVNACQAGTIAMHELDRRVLKILKCKEQMTNKHRDLPLEQCLHIINRPESHMLHERAYEQALTLVGSPDTFEHVRTAFINRNCCVVNATENLELAQLWSQTGATVIPLNQLKRDDERVLSAQAIIVLIEEALKKEGLELTVTPTVKQLSETVHSTHGKLLVVLLGNPREYTGDSCSDALLIAYEQCPPAHRAVMRTLQGLCEPKGILPLVMRTQ